MRADVKKLTVLKKSSQSTVWLCEDENGRKAVCKNVKAAPDVSENMKYEIIRN